MSLTRTWTVVRFSFVMMVLWRSYEVIINQHPTGAFTYTSIKHLQGHRVLATNECYVPDHQ